MNLLCEGLDAAEDHGNHRPIRCEALQLKTGLGEMFAAGGIRFEVSDQCEDGEEVEPYGGGGTLRGRAWGKAFPMVELGQDVCASV